MSDHSLVTDADALLRYVHDEARGEADAQVDIEPFLEAVQWTDGHFADVRAYLEEADFVYPVDEPAGEAAADLVFALTEIGVDYVARLKG